MSSTKNKVPANNNNNNAIKSISTCKTYDTKNRTQTLENISLNKQNQMKSATAIKLDQIKVPIEEKNHIQTSVALISEINAASNNNSNNTESHFDEEEDEEDEDFEEEQEEIEIKELNKLNNKKCSSQINFSANCNCSIYLNSGDMSKSNSPLSEEHANVKMENGETPGHQPEIDTVESNVDQANNSAMFTVEKASSSLKLKEQKDMVTKCESANPVSSTKELGQPLAISAKCKRRANTDTGEGDNDDTNGTNDSAANDSFSIKYLKKKSRFNLGRKHKSSRKKREKASAKRERKATKTLAIVLGELGPSVSALGIFLQAAIATWSCMH